MYHMYHYVNTNDIHTYVSNQVQFGNNCTSNSQGITQSEAECNFDCYVYRIAREFNVCNFLLIT